MKYSKCKEIDSLVSRLVRRGWSFQWGGKHGKVGHPTHGGKIIVPKTPSDYRAYLNFRSDVKRLLRVFEVSRH
jgi:hypothetical protein